MASADVEGQVPAALMAGGDLSRPAVDLNIPGYHWLRDPFITAALNVRGGAPPSTHNTAVKTGNTTQQRGNTASPERPEKPFPPFTREGLFDDDTATKLIPFNLPCLILANAHSLPNKMANLKERIMKDPDFQKCDFLCFTETWLHQGSNSVSVEGYKAVRSDRKKEDTQLMRGGGLAVLVKDTVKVEETYRRQTPNYELLVFTYEVKDHPEWVPPLVFILAYVRPNAKRKITRKRIGECYRHALECSKRGRVFLLGDLNWYELSGSTAPKVYQYVTCYTRNKKILDKCYGNVKQAYTSQCKAPLRSRDNQSDHNVIVLAPGHNRCSHSETKHLWECETSNEDDDDDDDEDDVDDFEGSDDADDPEFTDDYSFFQWLQSCQ